MDPYARKTTDGVFIRARRALTIGVLLAISLIAFETMAIATAMPLVARDIEGLTNYGWAFSAFMLGNLIGTVAAGESADRHGPLRPFVASGLCFATGLVLASVAPTWGVFIAARAVQGLAGGAIFTLGYVGIQRGYPEALRPRMMALVSTAWMVPALVGPAAAGFVAEHLSWRLVFVGLLPLLVIAAALVIPPFRRLGPPTTVHTPTRRVGTAVQLSVGTALVLLAFNRSARLAEASLLAIVGIAVAFAPLRKLLPKGTFRLQRGLPSAVALRAQCSYAFFGTEAFVPLGLTSLRGLSAARAGIALTAAAFAWVIGSWTQERLDGWYGERSRAPRALAGALLLGGGIALVGQGLLFEEVASSSVIAAWAAAGGGMGLAYPTTAVTALSSVEDAEAGAVSASLNLAEALAIALGTGLGGAALAFVAERGGAMQNQLTAALLVVALPLPIAVFTAARLRGRSRQNPA